MSAEAAVAQHVNRDPELVQAETVRYQEPRRIMKLGPSVDITAPSTSDDCRCSLCGQAVNAHELRCRNCGTRIARPGPGDATATASKRTSKSKDKKKRGAKGAKSRLKGHTKKATRTPTAERPYGTTGPDAEVLGYFREALRGDSSGDTTATDADAVAEGHALCLLEELSSKAVWPDSADSWAVLLDDVLGVGDEAWAPVLANNLARGLSQPSSVDAAVESGGLGNDWQEAPAAGVVVAPGTTGMAVLSDDDEWRWCVALELDPRRRELGEEFLRVQFTESMGLGKQQWVSENTFRPEWTVACADDDEGQCAMCHRVMPLTFHHLIPKEAANWVLSHGLSEEQMPPTCPGGQLTKEFLASHGILCCRACHSSIHRSEDNRTLALEWNTLDKIMSHEKIARFVAWASGQPTRSKADCLAQLPRSK